MSNVALILDSEGGPPEDSSLALGPEDREALPQPVPRRPLPHPVARNQELSRIAAWPRIDGDKK